MQHTGEADVSPGSEEADSDVFSGFVCVRDIIPECLRHRTITDGGPQKAPVILSHL